MPYKEFEIHESTPHDRPWITVGGALLAFIAGYVNVIALGFFHVPVSHMSGAASRVGNALAAGQLPELKITVSILISFFLGAMVSGMVIAAPQLRPGRRYGVVLAFEGVLLGIAATLLKNGAHLGVVLAAMACGLQNAMASSYYGLVIRTTHVTGIVTDLGVIAGRRLRGHRVPAWKIALLTALFAGFVAGGVAGAYALSKEGIPALWFAAAACVAAGIAYSIWLHMEKAAQPAR